MEINRFNFASKLNEIEDLIKGSDFVAFDCEFTGLSLNSEDRGNIYDAKEDRYQKVCELVDLFFN
jgi:hypothetical protein